MAFGDKVENSLAAPLIERKENCSTCDGKEKIPMEKAEFRRWLNHKILFEKLNPAEVREIKHEYKQSGSRICEDCKNGQVLRFS